MARRSKERNETVGIPEGFSLVTTLEGHTSPVISVAVTPDYLLALFHDATAAVGFALALHGDTGHAVGRIRAGVHVGQVSVDDGDAFGRHMNLPARVMGFAKGSGVVVSERVREDITHRAEEWSKDLR